VQFCQFFGNFRIGRLTGLSEMQSRNLSVEIMQLVVNRDYFGSGAVKNKIQHHHGKANSEATHK
jgi:hypothetical protein